MLLSGERVREREREEKKIWLVGSVIDKLIHQAPLIKKPSKFVSLENTLFKLKLGHRTRSQGSTFRIVLFRKTGASAGCRRRSRTSPDVPSPETAGTGRTVCSVQTPAGSERLLVQTIPGTSLERLLCSEAAYL